MNAKERSTAFLSGLPTDRFPFHPLVMQFAALKAGVPYSRCCLEHEQQCRVMLDCADRFGLDYVRAAGFPYCEAGVYGLKVDYRYDALPACTKLLIRDFGADIGKIRPLDIFIRWANMQNFTFAAIFPRLSRI